MPSLESVTFDTTTLRYQGEREGARIWLTPEDDGLGLFYFPLAPDINANLRSLDSVRRFYRSATASVGAAIIEVDTVVLDGCGAVRQIVKVPQQPHGMTYLGSFTIPFRDFSFVLKIQCAEHGTTGIRDTQVMHEAINDGRVDVDPAARRLNGWMQDPYDATLRSGFHRNLSEAEAYDSRFPVHPLSRVRRVLRDVQPTIRIDDQVRQSPPFASHA